MNSYREIKELIKFLKKNKCNNFALLKCTSYYPAKPSDSNVRTIKDMRKKFKCEVGLSDHTLGIGASIAAVANQATIIEKHFTLNKKSKGVDSKFSLEPKELSALVNESYIAWKSLGNIFYGPTKNEKNSLIFRRSIYVVKDIKKGQVLTKDNIKVIRPGLGLHPINYFKVIGKKISKNCKKGDPLKSKNIL